MLTGKTYLISGGLGRIGTAICLEIIARGGNAVALDPAEINDTNSLYSVNTDQFWHIKASATDVAVLDTAIEQIQNKFGLLAGAVHCAYPRSTRWGTPFEQLEQAPLYWDISHQLGGSILFAQRIVKVLTENGGGSLVMLSSIQGLGAPKFQHYEGTAMVSPIEYSAIKAGVNATARYLAKYLTGKNIRINVVSPGGIKDNQPESFIARYANDCISKGMLDAEDVVGAVCFLLSDESLCINGHNLVVDDGWSL